MKNALLLFLLMMLTACFTPVSTTPAMDVPVRQTTTAPSTAIGTLTPTMRAASDTPTAIPTSLPATATFFPVSRIIGPDNYQDVGVIQVYLDTINALVNDQYQTEPGNWQINMWAYSPDGRYLALGGCTSLSTAVCYDPSIPGHVFLYILDAQTAELIYSLPEEDIEVTGLSFSQDGKWLAYAVCPQRLLLFNMESQQTERTLWSNRGCGSNPKVVISPDGKQVAMVVDARLLVFDLATGRQLTEQLAQRHGSVLPKYNRDGTRLAVFSAPDGREIAIYDTITWQRTARFPVSNAQVAPQAVDFSADGRWVITADAGEDADILLWDAVTGRQIAALDEPLQWLNTVAFTPDGRLLLAGGLPQDSADSGYIAVWDTASLQRLGTITGMNEPGRFMFAGNGETFMASELFAVERYSLPDAALLAARQAISNLFAALAAGDYQTAAGLYQPLEEERIALQNEGLDPNDLPSALQALCAQETAPCLPIPEFVSGGKSYVNEYFFVLTFTTPDGSLMLDSDGNTTHWVYATLLPDGSWRVTYLPTFFFTSGK